MVQSKHFIQVQLRLCQAKQQIAYYLIHLFFSGLSYGQNESYIAKGRCPLDSAYPVCRENWVSDTHTLYVDHGLLVYCHFDLPVLYYCVLLIL